MMRMVIGSIDYLQSLRMVARARMLRVSERARQTHKGEARKRKKPLSSSLREDLNGGT